MELWNCPLSNIDRDTPPLLHRAPVGHFDRNSYRRHPPPCCERHHGNNLSMTDSLKCTFLLLFTCYIYFIAKRLYIEFMKRHILNHHLDISPQGGIPNWADG